MLFGPFWSRTVLNPRKMRAVESWNETIDDDEKNLPDCHYIAESILISKALLTLYFRIIFISRIFIDRSSNATKQITPFVALKATPEYAFSHFWFLLSS